MSCIIETSEEKYCTAKRSAEPHDLRDVRPSAGGGRERQGSKTMVKIFIDGSAGTTGLRIAERLAGREDLHVTALLEEKRKLSLIHI